jgi:quercetin dioxygenase-like cupin family protein
MHSHPDLVAIFQTDGRVKFTYPGGKTEVREMKAGQTLITPAVKHLPENLGDSDMEIILVELKTPKRRAAPKKPTTNTNTNGN